MLCLFYAVTVPFWSDNAATWDLEPRGVHCGGRFHHSTRPQPQTLRKRFVRTIFRGARVAPLLMNCSEVIRHSIYKMKPPVRRGPHHCSQTRLQERTTTTRYPQLDHIPIGLYT